MREIERIQQRRDQGTEQRGDDWNEQLNMIMRANHASRWISAWIVGLTLCCGWSAASANDLDRVLRLSGIESQIAHLPEGYKAGFIEQMEGAPPEIKAKIGTVIDEAFDSTILFGNIRHHLQRSVTERSLVKLLRWYDSDLGKRITQLEIRASTPEAEDRKNAMLDSLLADDRLMAQVKKLDDAVGVTGYTMAATKINQLAMINGLAAARGPNDQIDTSEVQQLIDQSLEETKAALDRYVLASMAFTYRSLSHDEFERYIQFSSRPETRNFNDLVKRAMLAELERANTALGFRIGHLTGPDETDPGSPAPAALEARAD